MPDAASRAMPVLYTEHLLLEARFSEDRVPLAYGTSEPERTPKAWLTDVSDALMLLASGPSSQDFVRMAFAGEYLEVGECAFEAVLSGDGTLMSIPLLLRTGTAEYVCFDLSPRSDVLSYWLSFLSQVESNGQRPFEDLAADDVGGSHVCLLLGGRQAKAILADYLHGQATPAHGHVASLHLDRIPCIVASLPIHNEDVYLLFVPPQRARTLWRSLLSFTELHPVGRASLSKWAEAQLGWPQLLNGTDTIMVPKGDLRVQKLIREKEDFVGARALASRV